MYQVVDTTGTQCVPTQYVPTQVCVPVFVFFLSSRGWVKIKLPHLHVFYLVVGHTVSWVQRLLTRRDHSFVLSGMPVAVCFFFFFSCSTNFKGPFRTQTPNPSTLPCISGVPLEAPGISFEQPITQPTGTRKYLIMQDASCYQKGSSRFCFFSSCFTCELLWKFTC